MSRNKKTLVALVAVILLAGAAWAFLPSGPDPQLVKVQQLQEKLFDPNSKIPAEERRQAFGELREEAEKLTPEQREELMRENPMARRMRETVVAYFDLPEKDRKAALDEQIDQMERFRKQREQERGNRPAGGGPPGGGPPGGFRGGNMDQTQRNELRKKMLDQTSPQERAMFSEYFQQMNNRRKERGMPTFGGPGGGPF